MRRLLLSLLLFAVKPCFCQDGWQIEVMPGIASYKGDLTQSEFPLNNIGPLLVVNLKYDFGDMIVLRTGLGWAKISGDDRKNKSESIKKRDLNFKSTIIDMNVIAEVNLLDPESYYSYPYLMVGAGLFHFNPYSYDKDNKKTYLHPLSTEGQGLPEYPTRKKYSLTQFYLPFGGGFKLRIKEKYLFSFETSVHFLFTDYLDDVSTTYVDAGTLRARKGDKAVELAFKSNSPAPIIGDQRGNSEVKDLYFFTGFKVAVPLNTKKKPSRKADDSIL